MVGSSGGIYLARVLTKYARLRLAKISDAGSDNWEYLATLPEGP